VVKADSHTKTTGKCGALDNLSDFSKEMSRFRDLNPGATVKTPPTTKSRSNPKIIVAFGLDTFFLAWVQLFFFGPDRVPLPIFGPRTSHPPGACSKVAELGQNGGAGVNLRGRLGECAGTPGGGRTSTWGAGQVLAWRRGGVLEWDLGARGR
jgi:hypothetical protein